jgi:DNA-directed RNA polymerase subunit A'
MHALSKIDMVAMEKEHRDLVRSGPKSKRNKSIQVLNALEGLNRNNIKPTQLMIRNVPVIPPVFRPFSVVGDTFMPGDANELYKDLVQYKDIYRETHNMFGDAGSGKSKLDLYDTVKAVYGYGDPTSPKTKQRGVSGFLHQITGTGPKWSFFQRKLISKPQDSVARGTIAIDPELSLNEIGVPEDMAWTMYAPYVQGRLTQSGMKPGDALMNVKERSPMALRALTTEMTSRPVIYSRAPSWHKFNVIAGRPKLVKGSTIMINPLITVGMNADFDGDAMNLHVPSQDDAVKEAWEKLMPSKMLWSIRDQDKVMPQPKQEMILGLYTANQRPAKNSHIFRNEDEAVRAIKAGHISLSDDVHIADPYFAGNKPKETDPNMVESTPAPILPGNKPKEPLNS